MGGLLLVAHFVLIMSRKVDLFRTVIRQPQPLSKFMVWMPIAPISAIVCTECELPIDYYAEDVISVNGQPVFFPTRNQVNNTWDCTFEESTVPISSVAIDMLKGLVNSNQKGQFTKSTDYFDKHVKMLFTNNPIRVAKNFKLSTTFVPVQDIVISLLGVDEVLKIDNVPTNSVILKAAWLQTIQPISLGSDKATTPLKYRLKFRYSAIKSITSI